MKTVKVAFGFNKQGSVVWFVNGSETINRLKCPACPTVLRVFDPEKGEAQCANCNYVLVFPREVWIARTSG